MADGKVIGKEIKYAAETEQMEKGIAVRYACVAHQIFYFFRLYLQICTDQWKTLQIGTVCPIDYERRDEIKKLCFNSIEVSSANFFTFIHRSDMLSHVS